MLKTFKRHKYAYMLSVIREEAEIIGPILEHVSCTACGIEMIYGLSRQVPAEESCSIGNIQNKYLRINKWRKKSVSVKMTCQTDKQTADISHCSQHWSHCSLATRGPGAYWLHLHLHSHSIAFSFGNQNNVTVHSVHSGDFF